MIKLVNISKIYNNDGVLTTGLHNVSLEFSTGEIVAIVGESGSGKSTLLNVLTKMDSFDEGEYYYKGNETSYFDIDDMDNFRKNKVGFIFQNYNIIDSYSVLENVMLPFILKGVSRREAKDKSLELIKKVGLYERRNNRGSQLSGGEKQRCVIARALASDCDILACDEPTGNLDSKTSIEIIKLIKEVAPNKLVLIVTHSYELIKDIVTRKIKVHDGEISEDIILNDVEKDQDEEMNLDYVPLKNKIKLEVAKNNLVYTPKRTILTTLVFFFVALFSFVTYQTTFNAINSISTPNSFVYSGKNKAIVFDIEKKGIDIEKIKEITPDYSINDFYLTRGMNCSFSTGTHDQYNQLCYEKNPINLDFVGEEPFLENDCILLVPSKSSFNEDNIIGQTINTLNDSWTIEEDVSFNVTGYQIREDISNFMVTKCDYFEDLTRARSFVSGLSQNAYDNEISINYINYGFDYSKENTKVYVYGEVQGEINLPTIKYNSYDFEIDLDIYQKEYVKNDYQGRTISVVFGKDLLSVMESKAFEVSVYSNNISFTIAQIENLGYSCINVSTYTTSTDLELFLLNIASYFAVVLSCGSMFIIFIISYLILSKIYSSKKKDYTILRTLGVTKKDMKGVVLFEVLISSIIASVTVFVVFMVSRLFFDKGIMKIFANFSWFVTIFFFVSMLLFAYIMGQRFNKKLFNFTVTSTFKGGDF